ncbi:hypothetical protein EV421DRAFT_1722264, partial [Armillaria borealis]
FQKWYLDAASVNTQQRTIAWKEGKPFHPENLSFRTIDTGRLLPMALANFRVQMYATKDLWDSFERTEEKEKWTMYAVLALMHRILIFRNIHDYGGGDIPIICINWTQEFVDMAMDYWVALSANKWTKEERELKCAQSPFIFCEIARTSHGLKQSFYELNLCVHALLLDENVGYVPPFIVLQISYTLHPAVHVRSPWVLESLPKICGSNTCTDSECIGLWRTEDLRSLHYPSPMVRDVQRSDHRVVCNLWGCEVQLQADPTTGHMMLQRCQKCRQVLYCSRENQARSLHIHKRVCEVPP